MKATLYIVEDNKYGGVGWDGQWNGMIGDIVKGKSRYSSWCIDSDRRQSHGC